MIFTDIETIPTDKDEIVSAVRANMKAPGNYSKPESIERWLNNPDNIDKAVDKTALSGLFGQIVCIGICSLTNEPRVLTGTEKEILEQFVDVIRPKPDTPAEKALSNFEVRQQEICGHNIQEFDAPFISQRMMVHGLGPLLPFGSKPWDSGIHDTMKMFAAGKKEMYSLKNLCLSLGVTKPLDEIDGSGVAKAWRHGEHQKIYDHCLSDVIATRDCYKAMLGESYGYNKVA